MNRVFLDSDIVLDFYVRREPHHEAALRLFTHLKRERTRCYTSAVVVANAYYMLSSIESPKYALDKMRKLRKLVSIAPLNESIIDVALSFPYKDFEDSIQFQCAIQNGIETIITRNTKDYPKDQLKVADPGQYLSAAALNKEG
jgi:predicted nucleic acid-binding protein